MDNDLQAEADEWMRVLERESTPLPGARKPQSQRIAGKVERDEFGRPIRNHRKPEQQQPSSEPGVWSI